MMTLLIVIQLIVSICLIVMVLLQKKSSGSGLLASNTYNSMFTQSSSNPVSKFILVLGVLIFINSIVIGILINHKYNISSDISAKVNKLKTTQEEKK